MSKMLDFAMSLRDDVSIKGDLVAMSSHENFDSFDEFDTKFEDVFGYSTKAFDYRELDAMVDAIIKVAPESVGAQINKDRENLIEQTLAGFDDVETATKEAILKKTIASEYGWQPPACDMLEDILNQALYRFDEDEDDEDDLDEEYDDEEDEEDE